jgi:outer membrane cobalamin receptor
MCCDSEPWALLQLLSAGNMRGLAGILRNSAVLLLGACVSCAGSYAASAVLTHDDIVRSGATTIPDLLRLVSGVQGAQGRSDRWAVGIRGFDGRLSRGLLVPIDGRGVYTPLLAGVYWDVQDLAFDEIDRIEVIRIA